MISQERYFKLASKLCYCVINYVKNNVGRDKRPNVATLECLLCWWEGGEAEKVGW